MKYISLSKKIERKLDAETFRRDKEKFSEQIDDGDVAKKLYIMDYI